jgi:drug/metabolite transporter (DMT)-like permease
LRFRTIIAIAVTLLFWSSAFAGIREGLFGGYSAGHLVLLRFLSASLVFALYACIKRLRVPTKRDMLKIALLGWTGISAYHIALTFGEISVPAGTASLIIAAAPALTALIASFALGERLNVKGWFGILLGFFGIALITFGSGESAEFTKGALLILLSAICTAVFFVYQKPLFRKYSPIELTAYFTWFGTLPMLVFAPGLIHDIERATLPATLAGIYIGVFPAAIAYVSWAVALSTAKASAVTSSLYINPVLAIFIAWIWLGEVPHIISLLGGAIAILGVVIVNLWGANKHGSAPNGSMTAAKSEGGRPNVETG